MNEQSIDQLFPFQYNTVSNRSVLDCHELFHNNKKLVEE